MPRRRARVAGAPVVSAVQVTPAISAWLSRVGT